MKTRLSVMLVTTATAAVLLGGCVSSKKYKSSQAALQQSKNDSARLAQQVASLNQNIQELESKNSALQRSLDSSSKNYANQQKSLNYYQSYFSQQQSAMSQVSEDLKGALTQAGLANEDVQQVDNTIYVRLDEDKIFKKNSTAVTSSGKQALSGVAQVIKSRSNVNVFVNDGDSTSGQGSSAMSSSSGNENAAAMNNANDNTSVRSTPRHRSSHRGMAARKPSAGASGAAQSGGAAAGGSVAANTSTPKSSATHKRVHRKVSGAEGSMTYYNNMPRSKGNKSWALKQGRMNMVANNFLQNGIPKVNISLQQPSANSTPSNNIRVVITPVMSDFNPQSGSSANTEGK